MSLRHDPVLRADETPWCSAFVNWCIHRALSDTQPTDSLLALSWMTWGSPVEESEHPAVGDLAVFENVTSTYQGHVGFYIAHNRRGNRILVLGGNQSDGVCFKWFPLEGRRLRLKGFRRG